MSHSVKDMLYQVQKRRELVGDQVRMKKRSSLEIVSLCRWSAEDTLYRDMLALSSVLGLKPVNKIY